MKTNKTSMMMRCIAGMQRLKSEGAPTLWLPLFLICIGFSQTNLKAQVTYTESFDGVTFVPSGWTNLLTSGSNSWFRVTSGTLPTQSPHSGAGEAKFDSYDYSGGIRSLITPPFSLVTNTAGAAMSFWMYRDNGYNTTGDKIDVYYNTAANLSGATLMGTVNRAIGLSPSVGSNGWYLYGFTIPSTVTNSAIYLIFTATSAYGNNIYIDDVSWTAYPQVCSGTPATPGISISTPSGCPGIGFNLGTSGASNDIGNTYQWYSASSSTGPFTPILNATLTSYATSTTSTTFYRMITTCTNSGLTSTTSVTGYTVVNPGPCICSSYGPSIATYSGDEDILNVVFGTLVNASTCSSTGPGAGSVNQRYSNYAGFVAAPDICRGRPVTFTVNIGTCGGWYGMYFNMYIDYNQNGLFSDPGELVYASAYLSAAGNTSGSITIPLSAITGITRMRIIAVESSPPSSPTAAYNWGETEDYCINILPNPVITLASSTGSVCPAATFTTTASGAATYSILGGPGVVSSSTISFSPLVNTNYTVTGTGTNNCVSPNNAAPNVSITTLAAPSLTVVPTSSAICIGATATLTATGANTYTWSPSTVTPALVVNPTATSVFTVSGTGTNVCNGVRNFTLVVNPLPTVAVSGGTICNGKSFTLTPSGASTYTYSGGASIISPSTSTSYSVTGTSVFGCVSASAAVANITVFALPSVSVSSGTICLGQTYLIQPSGAVTYSTFGFTNPVTPSVTSTFTLTGKSLVGCTSPPVVSTVVVMPLPSMTVNSSPTLACAGNTITLTVAGAASYTWNTGANTSAISDAPAAGVASYYVIGSDVNGCVSVATVTMDVFQKPSLSVIASNTLLCAGSSATLTAMGADSYSWSSGASNTSTISVSPTASTVYSVIGSNTVGCTKVMAVSVAVNTLVVNASANSAICKGSAITLTTSGGQAWLWSNSSFFNSIMVTPSVTSTYTVDVTDANNCHHLKTIVVTVNNNPAVTASVSSTTMCTNETATFTASGANSYSWSHNLGAGASVTIMPTASSNFVYIVTGTDNNNCSSTGSVSLIVSNCTDLKNENAALNISVYPNPSTGMVFIESSANMPVNYKLLDVSGRIVGAGVFSAEKSELDLRGYAAGLYYLNLVQGHGVQTVRIIKQ